MNISSDPFRLIAVAGALAAGAALAHGEVEHGSKSEAAKHLSESAAPLDGPATPFPADLGGDFELTNHEGETRSETDPGGAHQLFFFGYANCQAICSVAAPRMAEMAAIAAEAGVDLTPVMITVDPERDSPAAMKRELAEKYPGFVGLTGSEAALAEVRDLFQVEREVVYEHPEFGEVYAHGSFIYLMDPAGELLSVIPPILSPERGAQIAVKYAARQRD